MLIVYISATGKVDCFISKLGHNNTLKIVTGNEEVTEEFILVTGTVGFGEVPRNIKSFLGNTTNASFLKAVVGSGNKNWGKLYCKAAHIVAEKFNVPLLMTFESAGTTHDVENFLNVYNDFVTK